MEKIKTFFKHKEGAAAIHYGLIAALVDLAMIGAVYRYHSKMNTFSY